MAARNTLSVRIQPGSLALIGLLAFFFMPGMEVNGQDPANEKGEGLYQRLCAACHGKAGKGDGYTLFEPPPADLQASATQKKTDEKLLDTIRNGHANTAMGTWKYALSEEEMRQVLVYIRTLGQKQESR